MLSFISDGTVIDTRKSAACSVTRPPLVEIAWTFYISYGNMQAIFLFSAHISYGKGKYLNQTGFFFFFFTKFAKILFIFKFKGVTHRIQPT